MDSRRPIAVAVAWALLWPAAAFPQTTTCNVPTVPLLDNRDGYQVLFEEAPVYPMEMSSNGKELWVVNIPDASVTVFNASNPSSLTHKADVPVGLGPVTVRLRPGSDAGGPVHQSPNLPAPLVVGEGEPLPQPDQRREMWVVCQSSNSVFIVNEATKRVIDTVRLSTEPATFVSHEPAGLAFDEDGDFAYVTLSATNRVARIDANNPNGTPIVYFENQSVMPVSSVPTVQILHAEEPRALLLEGDDLFTLSQTSGNGTTPLNFPGTVFQFWSLMPGFPDPPPDRDLLKLDASNPGANATNALWRIGTMNHDVKRGPDGDLWVSNVDLLNDAAVGEPAYAALPGGFSSHRVSHAAEAAGTIPQATIHIDLNVDKHPNMPADYRCAMPNEMAFSADGDWLYAACYETRNTAVVNVATGQVEGELSAGGPASRAGVGPRGVLLNEDHAVAYVYNRGDNTVQVFPIPIPAPGASVGPVQTVSAGFDITPRSVLAGRFHFINAANSGTGTQTCNTCHPDGHTDMLGWDLGDFTGDPTVSPPEPRDPKGVRVTMSLRGIEETPPLHWRGDRVDLAAFNPAFAGLLGGSELSEDSELPELLAYLFRLSYPPNFRQDVDRAYSSLALEGAGCFFDSDAHNVAFDTQTVAPITCEKCHGMAGFSGTNNQVNNDNANTTNPPAEDGTQLRGMFDKASDLVSYVNGAPTPGAPTLFHVPAFGWGFASPGSIDSVDHFVNGFFGGMPQAERTAIIQFLDEFDSGEAATTAYSWTLKASTAGSGSVHPTRLMAGAAAGDNDLVARGWVKNGTGTRIRMKMLYDPFALPTPVFTTDTPGFGPYTFAALDGLAAASNANLALIGVPVGTGYRLGLDRDMDFLLDGAEAASMGSVQTADTDGDKYPDGYEVRFGFSANSPGAFPTTDATPPGITLAGPQPSWFNSNAAKLRWTTDEEAITRVTVLVAGTSTVVSRFEERQFKTYHVAVVRGMKPGLSYDLKIEAEDPANSHLAGTPGNTSSTTISGVTMQGHVFSSVHVETTTLTAAPIGAGQPVPMTATFKVVDETGAAMDNAAVTFKIVEWNGTGANTLQCGAGGCTANTGVGQGGVATFGFTSTFGQGSGAWVEVVVTHVADGTAHNGLFFHPLSGQLGFWKKVQI